MSNKRGRYQVAVVIPTFNGKEHLEECLRSLFAQSYRDFVAIVVDDASSDGSEAFVRERFPAVELIRLAWNSGFSAAVNRGISFATERFGARYIALLNNDTKTDPDWLRYLMESIRSDPRAAAVTSQMLMYDDAEIINSRGVSMTPFGDGSDIDIFKRRNEAGEPKRIVLAPGGGAMLLKREVLVRTGLFDERYFSYHEDIDWGWRANLMGYSILFEERAIVYHKFGATWKRFPFKKTYLCKRNALCSMLKNYEWRTFFSILPALLRDYAHFADGYLRNRAPEGGPLIPGASLAERIYYAAIPLRAVAWNLLHLAGTFRMRRRVQSQRTVSDAEIMGLMRE